MTSSSETIPPDAFLLVIGSMKSGTTTFFSHLAAHPAIARSRVIEPEYFSEHQGHGVEVKDYHDLWDYDPDRHRFCAEGSTGYTKYPQELRVPDRMSEAEIDPRFIYLVRDPLDRMESQFNHGLMWGTDWAYEDFSAPALLNLSRYFMQLQQYLLRFPDRERYRIVDFDDLVARPEEVMVGIWEWLGIDSVPIDEDRHENPTPERSGIELLLDDIDLSAPLALVPERIKEGMKRVFRDVSPGKKEMSPEERERAMEHLRTDMLAFRQEFDFPVEKWGFR